jgi:molecular chaperone HscB
LRLRDILHGVSVPTDYYELLGLPRQLVLSPEQLQDRFYELSRKWHPDRFARKPEAEQQEALDFSSRLNDAYRALRDPVKRAEHVLKQEGFDVGEQRSKDVPPELLEEVFELNLALEELRAGDESVRPQLEEARDKFLQMLAGSDAEMERLFVAFDQNQDKQSLGDIRNLLNRRKYIQNLIAQVPEASITV